VQVVEDGAMRIDVDAPRCGDDDDDDDDDGGTTHVHDSRSLTRVWKFATTRGHPRRKLPSSAKLRRSRDHQTATDERTNIRILFSTLLYPAMDRIGQQRLMFFFIQLHGIPLHNPAPSLS